MFKSSVIVRANGEEFETHNAIYFAGYAYFFYRIFGLKPFDFWRFTLVDTSLAELLGYTVNRPIWNYDFITDTSVGNRDYVNFKLNSIKNVAGVATLFEDANTPIITSSNFLTVIMFPTIVRTDFISIKYNIFI